jgi:hypothetical protein
LNSRLAPASTKRTLDRCLDLALLQASPVDEFMDLFAVQSA